MMGKMMGDMKNEVVKELADDDYVMSWMKESWTMKADGMGMKESEASSRWAVYAPFCVCGMPRVPPAKDKLFTCDPIASRLVTKSISALARIPPG